MAATTNLYMFYSQTAKGLFGFTGDAMGGSLPQKFSPWKAFGVVRPDQTPPHGLSRSAIETGVTANGYQLWRERRKAAPATINK